MNAEPKPREIRVFLSSTFKDMDAERNHLIKQVFPKVRAACLARQVGFTEIDLRWGVTEEESKNGATVEICLKEINRCRDFPPFFIGFLGERYGWIPCHEDFAAYWQRHADSDYGKQILQAVRRGISVTELEMEMGVLGSDDQPAAMPRAELTDHALFCLRSPEFSQALYTQAQGSAPPAKETDFIDPAGDRLAALKARIRQSGLLGLDNYASIEDFCAGIEAHLLAALDRYFPENEIPTAQQRTDAAHAAFRHQRLQNFLPRPDVRETLLARMVERLERPSLGPILLGGPSGQGKSALMADLARYLESTDVIHTPLGDLRYRVIDHYIGADDASSLDAWILRLLERLHPEIEHLTGPIPEATKDRREVLSTWFAYAARQSERQAHEQECAIVRVRFALLLDAVDQLADRGADLDLLKPEILGPDAILVASAADGTPAAEHERFQTTVPVPPLDDALRATLISATLQRFRKTLPDADARRLAQAPQAGSPLFLGLALEELRIDAHHETLGELVTDILHAPDAAQLFLNNFLLDPDYARPSQPDLAVRFMALLGASRAGLTENELADLQALPDDPVAEDTQAPRLPQKFLSNLLANFGPFLLNKEGRRAPMHRILGEVARRYCGEEYMREELYRYFNPSYGRSDAPFEARGAAEALHQITYLALIDKKHFERLVIDASDLDVLSALYEEDGVRMEDCFKPILFSALELSMKNQGDIVRRWKVNVHSILEQQSSRGRWIGRFLTWFDENLAIAPLTADVKSELLDVSTRVLGIESDDTLWAMSSLASSLTWSIVYREHHPLHKKERIEKIRQLDKTVLDLRRKKYGDEDPETLVAMSNYAASLSEAEEHAEALKIKSIVLENSRSVFGENNRVTIKATGNYANSLLAIGDRDMALVLLREAQARSSKYLGAEDELTVSLMSRLAEYEDDPDLAKKWAEQVLEIRRRTRGFAHRSVIGAILDLMGHLSLENPQDMRRRLDLHEEAISIFKERDGEGTLNVHEHAKHLANIVALLDKWSDLDERIQSHERLLKVISRHLGDESVESQDARIGLADIYVEFGDFDSASRVLEKEIEIRIKKDGKENEGTLKAMNALVNAKFNLNEVLNACNLAEIVVDTGTKVLGREHVVTLTAMNYLGASLGSLDRFQDAFVLQKEALEICRRTLDANHELLIAAENNYRITEELLAKEGAGITKRVLRWPPKRKAAAALTSCRSETRATIHDPPPTTEDQTMRLTETLKQWLKEQEWDDEPEINEEEQTSSTGFGYSIGDFSLKCWFYISEKSEVFKFFAYFLDSKAPEKKLDEVQKFVTAVSNRMVLGNLQLLCEDRTLRYYNAIDVENATFEPAHITNMLNAGVSAMEKRLPQYMAICFGGKTADEVLTEKNE